VKVWAAVAVALLAAGWFGFSYAYRTGRDAGSAAVRADWSADIAKSEKAAREALVAAHEAYRADIARREGVERDLQAKLGAADRRGRDLAGRLRTQACPLPGATHDTAPVPDGASGESSDAGEVGEALADHLAACERDATRFAELQDWMR
jgi:hypothetical protein